MEAVFLKLVNMSMTASYIVFAIVIMRLLFCRRFFKSAPRWVVCALWAFVALRLVCPNWIESTFSRMPDEVIPTTILMSAHPAIDSGSGLINDSINPIIADLFSPQSPAQSANPLQIVAAIASVVWLAGIAAMLAYALVSSIRLRLRLRESVVLRDNIYICDRIPVPFVFGVLRARIYLPSSLRQADAEYVIAHERAHLQRRDHIWKAIAYLLLSVYWFNPFMWLAYILLCRDIEFACDERVIRKLGETAKQPYAAALINCSVRRHTPLTYPLAFGEIGVKGRVKNVLNYKKPMLWVIVTAAVILILSGLYFLTDPPADRGGAAVSGTLTDVGNGDENPDVFSDVKAALDERRIEYTEVESSSFFLRGERRVLQVADDAAVVFYVYASPEEAAGDVQCISPDGLSITVPDGDMNHSYMIDWVSEVRWYLCRDTIVSYVGTDSNIISALDGLLGSPVAGLS